VETLRHALGYERLGWSVVPVHGATGGRCSCGRRDCPAPGKHPRVRWEPATRERPRPEEIRAWWRRWPEANVGVVTGAVSRVVVLDVDPRSHGDDALAQLEGRWGTLPPTVETSSGGGGRHLWFATDHELPSALLSPGLELKAERATVIVPPSLHASGGRYTWASGRDPGTKALAPLPDWVEALAHGDPESRSRHPLGEAPPRTTHEQEEFAAAWGRAGVDLRPGDRYYLCPFHEDTHPSLHVDSEGCRWFCFGCRRGGGIGRLLRLLGEPAAPVQRARRTGRVGVGAPVTLAGDVDVEAVGESTHQDELLTLSGGRRSFGGVDVEAVARLELDTEDPFETVVVRVLVDGVRVGRLTLEDAAVYRAAIEEAQALHGAATCAARIRGGWDRGGGDVGPFGVVLRLPRPGQPELPLADPG
jgi:hypothetical protein